MKNLFAIFVIAGLVISGCLAEETSDLSHVEHGSNVEERHSSQENESNQAKDQVTDGRTEDFTSVDKIEHSEGLTVLGEQLNIPWSIEMFDDVLYLTERPGNIVKIENGNVVRQRVELEKELSTAAEAGLLGFALAPDFSQTNQAYAYYTYQDGSRPFNRIVTLRLDGDVWKEETLLLDRIPSGNVHHGGRLKIGLDGALYSTTGDAADANLAQDLDSLSGKILRMNLDGSIPDDNPFPDTYIYSYGHRNPQGLTWLPDGTLYASEHGNRANDEINIIEAGLNYGWPLIQGKEQREGFVAPLFTSGDDNTWAPSGMNYADGKLYVAALRGNAVLEFDLNTGKHREVITGLGRIRDILIDGEHLYFITNNTDGRGFPEPNDDKLYRIPLSGISD